MNKSVPERVVVAQRHDGPHDHVVRVKLADGTEETAEDVIAAIETHEAHYVMNMPGVSLPLLLRVQQCPDCQEQVLYA